MFIVAPDTDEPLATPPAINATLILSALLVIALGVYPNLVLTVIERVQLVAGL
jgi:NADH-quinone oxidoreductase subunit N